MTPASYQHIDYLRRFRVVAYALVFVSILGFCYAQESLGICFLAWIGCALSWWLVETPGAKPMPRWLINCGVLLASFLLFWELVIWEEPNLLLGLGHFMIAILTCKLFEKKANRDYAQILTLTLLIMVAGAIFSQSLAFGILLAIYLGLGLYAILVFHLRFDTERALAAGSVPAEVIMSMEGQQKLRGDMRRMAFRVGLALLACAVALFVLFPRNKGRDMLGSWSSNRGTTQTGFSDRVRFGDFGRVQLSDAMVMEVRLDRDGANVGSEYYEPYFRGLVLDRYDPVQRQWLPPHPPRFGLVPEIADDRILARAGDYMQHSVTHQHYRQVASAPYGSQLQTLFSLSGGGANMAPVRFASDQVGRAIYLDAEMTLCAPGVSLPAEYDVYSSIITRTADTPAFLELPGDLGVIEPQGERWRAAMVDPLSDRARANTPDQPREHARVSPEIETMAFDIGGADIVDRARRHELNADEIRSLVDKYVSYLRSNYPYSLQYRQVDAGLDPTTDFLVNRKSTGGHCEFFASALVMLCRSASLNARMVTGYHGGEFNSIGGYYTVRQKHSHAWVEVMLPKRGWTIFDATPSAPEGAGGWNPAWLKSLRELMEVVQRNWLSRIVAFDAGTRQYILGTLRTWADGVLDGIKTGFVESWEGMRLLLFSSTSTWKARAVTMLGFAWCLISTAWLGRRWHRRRTSRVAQIIRQLDTKTQRELEVQLEFFDDLMRLLARTGLVKRDEMTPKEYAAAAGPSLGSAREDAMWLVDLFYAIRFGFAHTTPDVDSRVEASLHKIREAVATREKA